MRLREEDRLERARTFEEELVDMVDTYWRERDRRWEHADHLSPYGAAQASNSGPDAAVRVGACLPDTGSSLVRRGDDPTLFRANSSPCGPGAPADIPAAASPSGGVLPCSPRPGLVANASRGEL